MSHKQVKKPAESKNHIIKGLHNRNIECIDSSAFKMAWMQLDADMSKGGHAFQLCSEPCGDYIGYRDAKSDLTKLAISITDKGEIQFQLILPGTGDEFSRLRNFTLEQLERIISTTDLTKV